MPISEAEWQELQDEFDAGLEDYIHEWSASLREHFGGQVQECGGKGGKPGPCPAAKQASKILAAAGKLGAKAKAVVYKIGNYAVKKYQDLEKQYGRAGAIAILGATVALTPVPLPGTSLAPIAIAKAYTYLKSKFGGGEAEEPTASGDALVVAVGQYLHAIYQAAGEETPKLSDEDIIKALAEHGAVTEAAHGGEFAKGGGRVAGTGGKAPNLEPKGEALVNDVKKALANGTDAAGRQELLGRLDVLHPLQAKAVHAALGLPDDQETFHALNAQLRGAQGGPSPTEKPADVGTAAARIVDTFGKVDAAKGGHNFVHLGDLRAAHPELSKGEFDAAIQHARKTGKMTLSPAEGRHGISAHDRDSAIHEPSTLGHGMLLYASLRK